MTGIVAAFGNETALVRAVDRLRAIDLGEIETYTPVPLTTGEASGRSSLVPVGVFLGGIAGAAFMYGLETLATASSWGYPVDIGGHPPFSWPGYVPIAVAFGLLTASASGLLGYLLLSGGPRLWDAVDEFEGIRSASRDGFLVHVHSEDETRIERARAVLVGLNPLAMRVISVDEEEVPT